MTHPKIRLSKIEKKRGKPDEQKIIMVWAEEDREGDTITLEDGSTMTKAEYLRTHPEEFEQIIIHWED